jgi:RNA-directed DNA polymerase
LDFDGHWVPPAERLILSRLAPRLWGEDATARRIKGTIRSYACTRQAVAMRLGSNTVRTSRGGAVFGSRLATMSTSLIPRRWDVRRLHRIERRTIKPVTITGLEPVARDAGRELYHQFCNIVGGVASPLLANIALHGLEEKITQAFPKKAVVNGKMEWSYRPKVVKYADDLVILHQDLEVIKRCQEITKQWLAEMGLELKESKTRITHTLHKYDGNVGFDFLGFKIQQFLVGKSQHRKTGIRNWEKDGRIDFKTIIKPSKKAVKTHYRAVAETISRFDARPQAELIRKLNPQIRGWCRYYSTVVSKMTFNKLDHLVCQRLLRWGRRRHQKQSRKRMVAKYFNINRDRGSHRPWDFIAPDGTALLRYADTRIKRHVMVKATRSPYDGDFVYWATRMGNHPMIPKRVAQLLKRQGGKCVECGLYFWEGEKIGIDYIIPKKSGGRDAYWNWLLLHTHCYVGKLDR